jgi:hypothetical protein
MTCREFTAGFAGRCCFWRQRAWFFLAAWRLTRPDVLQWDDFVVYWAAGRLNGWGQNPYDWEALFALERMAGRPPEEASAPLGMWNPPWTLVLFTPFGMLPYPLARSLWFLFQMSALVWSADRLWFLAGGNKAYRLLSWLLALLFGPALHALKVGQASPLLLLGAAGFLHFARQERWWAASAMVSLLFIKPHVCYLVLAGLFLRAILQRRWALVGGLFGGPSLALLVVALTNPAALPGSLQALLNSPAREQATPTLGAWLRFLLGIDQYWLQFLPSVVVFILFVRCLLQWREKEVDKEHLGQWTLFSLLTMPYGWTFDHVVALIALIPLAIRLGWRPREPLWWGLWGAYLAVDTVLLFVGGNMFWHIWLAPFWLLWAAMAHRLSQQLQLKVIA